MQRTLAATLLTLGLALAPALAQFTGPNGMPATVRQLLAEGRDHEPVVLTGRILSRLERHDLYAFSDGSATVTIRVSPEHWPHGLRVDEHSRVEIAGRFEREWTGITKVKVGQIRLAP
ncbi:MAG: NirD/YgiW/YdeI family stress tolerance protein [Candidatus Dactylopiibacterium sp.]|nr:NirD/YgiW/YdeI family stress tolerance protein [Candidatus Dactylopiibacterium sp.]